MNALSEWIRNIVTVSLLSSIASALCENITSAKKAIPLITTAALIIVTIIPLKGNSFDYIFDAIDEISDEYSVKSYDEPIDELTMSVTAERLSKYAVGRLRENNAECEVKVYVELRDEGYYAPSRVDVYGDAFDKAKLSDMLKKELSCDVVYWDGERQ